MDQRLAVAAVRAAKMGASLQREESTMADSDKLTFDDVAAEYSKPLLAYLVRMTRNSADAHDLLQEALIKIARELPNLRSPEAVKGWAYRVATNVAIDHLRKSAKVQFVELDGDSSGSEVDAEEELVVDEMNECIRGVIDGLPPDYRAAIVLSNLQGFSVAETAEIMGTSVTAAKVRIHRAKAKLREALNQKCDFYRSESGNLRCDVKQGRPPPG
jgi:RNA polymerase sigma-70 factor (ECF subfamily)